MKYLCLMMIMCPCQVQGPTLLSMQSSESPRHGADTARHETCLPIHESTSVLVHDLHARNRIYAMISLMDLDKPKVVPDYGASNETVFLDVVEKHVK